MNDDELRALPKAEVHVHLEGCFDVDTLVALAERAGEGCQEHPSSCSSSRASTTTSNSSVGRAAWCDPVDWKHEEIGRHLLTGWQPEPGIYT